MNASAICKSSMIPEKEERDEGEGFFQILLIGALFTPFQLEDREKNLREIFRKFGVILNSSDLMILDRSRIGNSTITIARYSLDYVHAGDATGKRVCVEGLVTVEIDELGSTHIKISSKTAL